MRSEKIDQQLRKAAVKALGEMRDQEAAPPLRMALRDNDGKVRQTAAYWLGELSDKQAVEPLMTALNDPETLVRTAALTALGKIGDKRALPALTTALESSDSDTKKQIAGALANMADPLAAKSLLTLTADKHLARAAVNALEKLLQQAANAVAVEELRNLARLPSVQQEEESGLAFTGDIGRDMLRNILWMRGELPGQNQSVDCSRINDLAKELIRRGERA